MWKDGYLVLESGKYLEIFSPEDYPFADWYSNLPSLVLENCYLLKAEK